MSFPSLEKYNSCKSFIFLQFIFGNFFIKTTVDVLIFILIFSELNDFLIPFSNYSSEDI